MSPQDDFSNEAESVLCPYCGAIINTQTIIDKGFMVGRPAIRGGPYYRSKCVVCHNDYDCFFEKEIFTRKRDSVKAFLHSWPFCLVWEVLAQILPTRRYKRNKKRKADAKNSERESEYRSRAAGRWVWGRAEDLPLVFKIHPELIASFRVLGLDVQSSSKQIKARYKELVKTWHPDRYSSNTTEKRDLATKKLIEINRAYGTIKDHLTLL